ncbi:hypothetical protein O3G_MSEX001348 [Manduca sexta]|uniref:Uncharacterized protein n=1 Tax=Manduca sexta TaxID=7130 RepID=A0A921YJZ4_MANSE|nr:hypothetical protein O3G_MSEX001348 [Manduca sexta]
MSEQEKTSGGTAPSGPSVVMVESGARHKQPYRPTELQDEPMPDLHHKRSRAPAVPSVAEDLKAATETSGTKERKESERAMSSDKYKSNAAKKLSSHTKRRGSSPEAITLAPLEVETKRAGLSPPPQPIPAQVESMGSTASDATDKFAEDKRDDEDSIKEEIAELRTSVAAKPSSEWCDDEEAGGLPRSESRASRVSRAVRQLFCCGAAYEAPSEEDISPRGYIHGI